MLPRKSAYCALFCLHLAVSRDRAIQRTDTEPRTVRRTIQRTGTTHCCCSNCCCAHTLLCQPLHQPLLQKYWLLGLCWDVSTHWRSACCQQHDLLLLVDTPVLAASSVAGLTHLVGVLGICCCLVGWWLQRLFRYLLAQLCQRFQCLDAHVVSNVCLPPQNRYPPVRVSLLSHCS